MKKLISVLILLAILGTIDGHKAALSQDNEIAGTFFGDPVSKQNYYFVLKIVISFSSPWGGIPNNREQLEKRVWDDLILSYEAFRRQIPVGKEEVEDKISETLKGNGATFNWKEEPQAYEAWAKDTLNISVEAFENQMQHLVKIKKLHEQVRNSFNPTVTEDEAFQEFMNEQNNLSVELAEFENLKSAEEFYEKVSKNSEYWDEASKKDKSFPYEDRTFRTPGFVALEFLMHMWQFPKEAVFNMIEMKPGEFYPPTPIYKGYGVFKVLEVRRADESKFPDRKDSYFDQLKNRKRYDGFKNWLKNLKEDADMQVYIEPPYGIFN